MPIQAVTFKEAFCHYFNCPVEQFEEEALWTCFYPHWCLLAKAIYWFWPGFFRIEIQIIKSVGWTRSMTELQSEASSLREAYRKNRLRRDFFHFRISGRELVSLAGCFLPQDRADTRFYLLGRPPSEPARRPDLAGAENVSKVS